MKLHGVQTGGCAKAGAGNCNGRSYRPIGRGKVQNRNLSGGISNDGSLISDGIVSVGGGVPRGVNDANQAAEVIINIPDTTLRKIPDGQETTNQSHQ